VQGLPLDLYDYELPSSVRNREKRGLPYQAVRVVDAWPSDPPVSSVELDVFEAHFAAVLELIFSTT